MDTYRILLTGAQGTGKSTLARAISARLRAEGTDGLASLDSAGGAVSAQGHTTGGRAGADTVRLFARLHQAREAEGHFAVGVFDRCLLDTLAYALVLDCLDAAELQRLQAAALASSRRADQLLWCRIACDYPAQGPQDETPAFRREIDAAIARVVSAHRLPVREHPDAVGQAGAIVEEVWRCYAGPKEARR
jgi:predicted ATPase